MFPLVLSSMHTEQAQQKLHVQQYTPDSWRVPWLSASASSLLSLFESCRTLCLLDRATRQELCTELSVLFSTDQTTKQSCQICSIPFQNDLAFCAPCISHGIFGHLTHILWALHTNYDQPRFGHYLLPTSTTLPFWSRILLLQRQNFTHTLDRL